MKPDDHLKRFSGKPIMPSLSQEKKGLDKGLTAILGANKPRSCLGQGYVMVPPCKTENFPCEALSAGKIFPREILTQGPLTPRGRVFPN
jgi:hypothetical protein